MFRCDGHDMLPIWLFTSIWQNDINTVSPSRKASSDSMRNFHATFKSLLVAVFFYSRQLATTHQQKQQTERWA
jgi:hypothetical protein